MADRVPPEVQVQVRCSPFLRDESQLAVQLARVITFQPRKLVGGEDVSASPIPRRELPGVLGMGDEEVEVADLAQVRIRVQLAGGEALDQETGDLELCRRLFQDHPSRLDSTQEVEPLADGVAQRFDGLPGLERAKAGFGAEDDLVERRETDDVVGLRRRDRGGDLVAGQSRRDGPGREHAGETIAPDHPPVKIRSRSSRSGRPPRRSL